MKNKNWKPLRILFIGDEPSSRNVSPDVPFVGTASYKRLLRWIGELDLDISKITLKNSGYITLYNNPDKIVFLGNKAAQNTKIFRPGVFDTPIPNFKIIDHPSPRNRKFNDPKYEAKMLKELKKWLYE